MKLTGKNCAGFSIILSLEEVQEYPDGTTVGEIVDRLEIDRNEIGITMINSRHCAFEDIATEDDILAIFPMVGGG